MTPNRRANARFLLVTYRHVASVLQVPYNGFIVHSDGRIERPGATTPSNAWRCTGAVRLNNFGHVVERWTLADMLDCDKFDAMQWHHRNGKQRVFLTDSDHGTGRVMFCPVYDVQRCDLEHVERMRYNASIHNDPMRYRFS